MHVNIVRLIALQKTVNMISRKSNLGALKIIGSLFFNGKQVLM